MIHIEERHEERTEISLSRSKFKALNKSEIRNILAAQEEEKNLSSSEYECIPICSYFTNTYAANHHNEDRHAENLKANTSFFGVYDGHGGESAANFARDNIIQYAQMNLSKVLKSSHDNSIKIVQNAIETSFVEADKDFLKMGYKDDSRLADVYSGACMILACTIGKYLFVANAGDCRAVLGRCCRDADTGDVKQWKAIPLSSDHTAETEEARLRSEHPDEWDVVLKGRVKGNLEPSRCLGDALFKDSIFNLFLREDYRMPEPFHPPYVTAKPDVIMHELTEADSFLVIGTDGLWDRLSNQEVVDIISAIDPNAPEENPATVLIEKVLENSVRINGPDASRLSYAVQLPSKVRRLFHDDITVTVIFFDSRKIHRLSEDNIGLNLIEGTFDNVLPKAKAVSY